MKKNPHIVIVGGGAGGLCLATKLGKKLGKRKKANITLVDSQLTHIWKPLIHEVASGTLNSNEDELNYLTHACHYHFNFQIGEMIGLDRQRKCIQLHSVVDGEEEIIPTREIHYDILVLAVGSQCNDFNIPGVKEHCLFLDSRQQADRFHRLLLKNLMHVQYNQNDNDQLNIAIVGGGATGVELAAELHFTLHNAKHYGLNDKAIEKNTKITLIESQSRLLSALPNHLSIAVDNYFKKLGVTILYDQRVVNVDQENLTTDSGIIIKAPLKVWAAGIKAPDFLQNIAGLETNRINQIVVKKNLQTTRDDAIFAFGDCAACPIDEAKNVPPRAQSAHQQATCLVKSICYLLQDKPLIDYRYRDYGSLISLSYYNTVGQLMSRVSHSLRVEGFIARLVYQCLYKMHQTMIFGWWRVTLLTIANFLTRRIKPRLKMH